MSDELSIYYNKVIARVDSMRKEKKFEDALNIIVEELQAPYIPTEFENKLAELLAEVTYDKNYEKGESKFADMPKDELFERIEKNEASSLFAILLIFEKYWSELSSKDIEKFKKIVNSRIHNNDIKIVILEKFKEYKPEEEFIFYSKLYDKEYKIDLSKQKFINEQEIFSECFIKLGNLYDEEPKTYDLANEMAFLVFNHYFPNYEKVIDSKNLVLSIVQAIQAIFKGTSGTNHTTVAKDILKIMKKQGENL